MSVDLYQPFSNFVTGETFRCISSSDEAYISEWIVEPSGFVPFEHIHPNQDEIFHVKQGEMRAHINGIEAVATAGQTVTVPRGARHIAANNTSTRLVCVLEYRPGLDSYKIFQCFGGLCLDNDIPPQGIPNPLKMLYFLEKAKAKTLAIPTYMPAPFFRLGMKVFYGIGLLLGWEKAYRKYTESVETQ